MFTVYATITTALGKFLALSNGSVLTGLYAMGQKHMPEIKPDWQHDDKFALFLQVTEQLDEYYAGMRDIFEIPYRFVMGTPFQQKVWQVIACVPHGTTISYSQLAQRIGAPSSARAVGMAVGRNPITIFVPCHRIIGSNRSLTGYAGGLEKKRALLSLEKIF